MTLVDGDRHWMKAAYGPLPWTTPGCDAFCADTLRQQGVVEVPDTLLDPRFADNPLVTPNHSLKKTLPGRLRYYLQIRRWSWRYTSEAAWTDLRGQSDEPQTENATKQREEAMLFSPDRTDGATVVLILPPTAPASTTWRRSTWSPVRHTSFPRTPRSASRRAG